MSIKISNLKNIQQEYKDYIEAYFEKGSMEYKNAIKEFENNKVGLIGLVGENTVSRFSVIYNPDTNSFISSSNDKYKENQIQNFKQAKREASNFLSGLRVQLESTHVDKKTVIDNEDKAILNMVNCIDNISDLKIQGQDNEIEVKYDNTLVSLNYEQKELYAIDKNNPIITTQSLFHDYQVVEKLSFEELPKLIDDIEFNFSKINEFNNLILNDIAKDYPSVEIDNKQDNNSTINNDYGFRPSPSF